MAFGVLIHRSDSVYDDSPAERYQFPRQYLRRIEACVGDWIIYYEPRKVAQSTSQSDGRAAVGIQDDEPRRE